MRHIQFTRRPLLQRLLHVFVINLLCALLISKLMSRNSNFVENLVFSNCIGYSCFFMVHGACRAIWRKEKPPLAGVIATTLLLTPVGYFTGSLISAWIYAYPVQAVLKNQLHYYEAILSVSAVAATIGAWSMWNRARISELQAAAEAEKARSAAIERQAVQSQLQMLQAQIEPHMLFNTLANLQGLIALDPDRAQHMLAQLITYMRATLQASRAAETSLAQEFTLIKAYLELLAIRMGKRLQYQTNLPESLAQARIAPMLLQPLVENAIKHGLEPAISGGTLIVSASEEQQQLVIRIADTGLGLPDQPEAIPGPDALGNHVGNANLRQRLQALYGDSASFHLYANQPAGAVSELRLPLNLKLETNEKQP